jgi:hypothetical protein
MAIDTHDLKVQALTAVSVLLLAATAPAQGSDSLASALRNTKPIIDARIRTEHVEQTPLAEEAEADTIRLRLGFETGKAFGTSLLAEGEFIIPFSDDYREDASQPGDLQYPLVPDAESQELNRLQLVNSSLPGTTMTLGRQRIVLDDQRFVGNVGWRQNEQTFDAARIVNKSVPGLTLDATYLNQVNRVFGPESPQGRYEGDGMLANAAYQTPLGKITGFGYWLDFDHLTQFPGLTPAQAAALDPARVSNATYGVRFAGERPLGAFKVGYLGSYARQSDYGSNPFEFELDYYTLEFVGTFDRYSATLGQEVLDGNGAIGFATPLATLHRFNGWADKFLTTPVNGIDDRYVGLGYALKLSSVIESLSATAAYHEYESERGAIDLGTEANVQVQAKFKRFTGLVKYAVYDAHEGRTPAQYQDTTKFWVQLEFMW